MSFIECPTDLVGMHISTYLFLLTPVYGRFFDPLPFCGIGRPLVVGRVRAYSEAV
jgi:hypothetical protein